MVEIAARIGDIVHCKLEGVCYPGIVFRSTRGGACIWVFTDLTDSVWSDVKRGSDNLEWHFMDSCTPRPEG
jgi:hypothetical protein